MNNMNYKNNAETQNTRANEAILAALHAAHKIASPTSTAPEDLKRQRLGQEALGRLLTPPIGFTWEPFEVEGIPAAWVRPEGAHDRSKMILYCHGGGYTSGTLGYARMLPWRMVLFSPWTDLTASGESYTECRERDPLLTREYIEAVRDAFAPGADWSLPEYSPLFADLRELPPTLIQVGGREILRDDSTRLYQKLQEAGVPSVLQSWPEMWHVFQMFPLKTAEDAMEQAAQFLETLR